jgi:hypothetical protein
MAPSDLDQLVEMGFDPEKSKMAVKKTGGCMFVRHVKLHQKLTSRQWLKLLNG